MAAYINRSLSSMAGDNSLSRALLGGGDGRSLRDSSSSSSPLQIFVQAKKKINDIYKEIDGYVADSDRFVQNVPKEKEVITTEEDAEIRSHVQKVRGIRDVLARDHMKVVFFGRTSNGKSTVINAMLHEKILPSGIGHTTNCFLQVEGSDNGDAYLLIEGSEERQNVKSVGQLGHALCKEKLGESTLVRVFWPKHKCPLLRDDVVFVDSPGIDVSPNLDEWIDKHCLDADVFVLVANAESTLMLTEKNFFHKVSQRLSKPNIFILNNRWDASASEPEFLDEVRAQHMERTLDFLFNELKVCTREEALERIFFVSAREALQGRLQEQKGMPAHTGALAEGFPSRYFEFQDFERKFESCISKSAVKTKFEQHSKRGKQIASDIRGIMNAIYDRTLQSKEQKTIQKKELWDKLDFTEKQLELLTHETKEKICLMVEDVNEKVAKALNEEIQRLSVLVEEFCMPFHPDPLVLNVYKRELHAYVETGLGSNLRARLSTTLSINIEHSQKEMTDRMAELLPADKKQVSLNLLPRREPFEVLYRLNCENLCSDFKEDIQFRFSLGPSALLSKFLRSGAASYVSNISNSSEQVPRPYPQTPQTPVAETFIIPQNDWALVSRVALATVTSQGTMGGLLCAGFVFKVVGWRGAFFCGSLYGAIYLYERLTWTNKAKERSFKNQYVDYMKRKLRMIVDLTSANCSHQVQQELSSTMARLSYLIDETRNEMKSEMKQLDKEMQFFETNLNSSKTLRNKANYLINELEMFDEAYLADKE